MKAIFRKIFIIFFLSIYTVTASGFHLVLHYCGERLAFIDVNGYHHAEGCCADESIFDLLNTEASDGCCKSKSAYIKIKADQFSVKNIGAKYIEAQAIQLFFSPISFSCSDYAVDYFNALVTDTGPPEPNLPHYLSYHNLRI